MCAVSEELKKEKEQHAFRRWCENITNMFTFVGADGVVHGYRGNTPTCLGSLVELEEGVELAVLLERGHGVKVADVLVVDEDDGEVPGAGLLEDGVPVLLLHDVDGDPGLKVGPQVDLLGLEEALEVEDVPPALLGGRGGRVEHADLALTTKPATKVVSAEQKQGTATVTHNSATNTR